MNFALLGDDLAALPLVKAIAAHPDHALTHAAAVAGIQAELMQSAPAIRILDHWEELLTAENIDAVLIAGSGQHIYEGAKQLATIGKPLLISPRADQSAELIYELALVHDDNNVILHPAIPLRVHPALNQIQTLLQDNALGKVLHIEMQREINTENTSLLSWTEVDAALLSDADLLRSLGGNYARITALPSGTVKDQFSRMTVTQAGDNLPEATWTLNTTTSQPNWKLTITGENGKLILGGSDKSSELTLESEGIEIPPTTGENNPGKALLTQFESVTAGTPTQPTWTDLMRAFEVLDASRRSVRRRRTIELYFDTQSERNLFKTHMTAIGCGIISLTLPAVVVLLMVGALFDPETMSDGTQLALKIARIAVFAPLFIFLAFQLLLFITRPASDEKS